MKEAAGEANLTVVAIILIAVVVAVATPLVSSLMMSASEKTCCTDAGGYVKDNACYYQKDAGAFSIDEWQRCCSKVKTRVGPRNPCQNARGE